MALGLLLLGAWLGTPVFFPLAAKGEQAFDIEGGASFDLHLLMRAPPATGRFQAPPRAKFSTETAPPAPGWDEWKSRFALRMRHTLLCVVDILV